MSSCSRILKKPSLLAVFGLWSLLAFFLVAPFTVHAAAIAPMEKTSYMGTSESPHLSITVRNHTNNLMKLIGASVLGGKWGMAPVDVGAHSDITFDASGIANSPSGISGGVTWRLNGDPKTPIISILLADPYINGDDIVSNPPDAVLISSSIDASDNDIHESFTISPQD